MENSKSTYLNDTAIRIATDRYFTEEEKQMSPDIAFEHACDRIAKAVSLAEKEELQNQWRNEFYKVIVNKQLIPAGRFWANAGQFNQQFPNCFVFPIKDTKVNGVDGIFDTLSTAVVTASGGGGTGFDFSRLRSRGIKTTKSRGVASGPVSFIKSYDAVMENIQQGGSRRAANMGILRVDHPDILEFIFLKDRSQKYRRFNVSVGITDIFMKQLEENPYFPWLVTDPHTKENYYIVVPSDNSPLKIYDLLKKRWQERQLIKPGTKIDNVFHLTPLAIWQSIIQNAWECGDPGLFFIDTANKANPLIDDYQDSDSEYYIRATNPCGEIPMEDNSICMLSAINLAAFVADKVDTDKKPFIKWDELKRVASIGVRFLDDALDVSDYPTEENKEKALNTRRIGLGLMGWADLLIKMKIVYGSPESIELAKTIMKIINTTAFETSVALGTEKGNFPLLKTSQYNNPEINNRFPFTKTLRNSYRTTIAPTGTSSLVAGVNESLEPLPYFEYLRKDETGEHIVEHPLYEEYIDSVLGVIGRMDQPIPPYFITAMQIPYDQHVKMQAAFQEYVDNAISKTINLPKDSTSDDIEAAYKLAFSMGCKGITCYRDGSKEIQVLNAISSSTEVPLTHSVTREEGVLPGLTWKVKTGEGTCYITINKNGSQHPVEVFIKVGKAGSDINAYSEALGRVTSIALQHKVDPNILTKQLIGISGDKVVFHNIGNHHRVLSVPDAVGKVLEDFQSKVNLLNYSFNDEALKEEVISFDNSPTSTDIKLCDKCHQPVKEIRGCRTCGCGSTCEG